MTDAAQFVFMIQSPPVVYESLHQLDPAVAIELITAFTERYFELTQTGPLVLYAFPRVWEEMLVWTVRSSGETSGCFHSARTLWVPEFAPWLAEKFPEITENLRVREQLVTTFLQFVEEEAGRCGTPPLQVLVEALCAGGGPFCELNADDLAVPLPFCQALLESASFPVSKPYPIRAAGRPRPPLFDADALAELLTDVPPAERYDAYVRELLHVDERAE